VNLDITMTPKGFRKRKIRKAGVSPLDEIEAIVKGYDGIDAAGLIIQIQGVIEKQKGVKYE
jgi:hypothetical protein